MNIIKAGSSWSIFGEAVQTFNELPKGTYGINFNPMTGYSLRSMDSLEVKEKVYGAVEKRIEKILNTFKKTDRNLGVILYGKKGSGKSMTARLLACTSEYPVIVVDGPTPGLADFLMSIKQEVIVLFDEFEKHFIDSDCGRDLDEGNGRRGNGEQGDLLSLFDGVDGGKKLFVITCNEKRDLNDYYLNRPGRFHYLFTYDKPATDEIKEYLVDNLKDPSLADSILKYNKVLDLTYDTLRAICSDVNLGYSVEETIADLNVDTESRYYTITVVFKDGHKASAGERWIEPFANDRDAIRCIDNTTSAKGRAQTKDYRIQFNPKDMIIGKDGTIIIPGGDLYATTINKNGDKTSDTDDIVRLEFEIETSGYSAYGSNIGRVAAAGYDPYDYL